MNENIWEKHGGGEFLQFDNVKNKRSGRADLHAFLLLDELFPVENGMDIVSAAEHDQIWLGIESQDIAKLTEPQILELVRCGVMLDVDVESLSMFV